MLREVADVLWTIVRNTDRPARYGGDEFVIVMPETDKTGAASLGERIRETIASKAFATGANVRVTASLGLATYPDDAGDANGLLDRRGIGVVRLDPDAHQSVYTFPPTGLSALPSPGESLERSLQWPE